MSKESWGGPSFFVVCLGFAFVIAANAAETAVNQLVAIVRAGIKQHTPDKMLAKSVHKLTLSEKLYLRAIEELESEGAGPETVAAMDEQLDASHKKPEPTALPPFESPARPTIEEQKQFFRLVDVNAMHYTASLPDFICTEMVHRYELVPAVPPGAERKRGQPAPPPTAGFWTAKDVLSVKLSYFDNRENYKLILVNGKKTKETYESSGGATSEGDFGSILLGIFAPDSGTKFQWDHWTHLRKRVTQVYSYRTTRDRSHSEIGVSGHRVKTGRRGFIYADNETQMVMRIVGEAVEIPGGFPVTAEWSMLDYDYATISGQQFLLPLRADMRMDTARLDVKNVIEFKDYRKFTGESTISFDGPNLPAQDAATPAPEKKSSPDEPK